MGLHPARPQRLGNLRERVSIIGVSYADDGYGGVIEVPGAVVATVFARIEPMRAEERLAAMQVQSSASHRIWMRYRADVTPTNEIIEGVPDANGDPLPGMRRWKVTGVLNPDERRQFIVLDCETLNG